MRKNNQQILDTATRFYDKDVKAAKEADEKKIESLLEAAADLKLET